MSSEAHRVPPPTWSGVLYDAECLLEQVEIGLDAGDLDGRDLHWRRPESLPATDPDTNQRAQISALLTEQRSLMARLDRAMREVRLELDSTRREQQAASAYLRQS